MANDGKDLALLEWEARQPEAITGDPIWRLNCYREALFLIDRARDDILRLGPRPKNDAVAGQLLSAIASISANIGEGYGRPSVADRTRFFSYALGSVREAVTWYQVLQAPSRQTDIADRLVRLARIRRMILGLLGRLRDKRGKKFDSW